MTERSEIYTWVLSDIRGPITDHDRGTSNLMLEVYEGREPMGDQNKNPFARIVGGTVEYIVESFVNENPQRRYYEEEDRITTAPVALLKKSSVGSRQGVYVISPTNTNNLLNLQERLSEKCPAKPLMTATR